MPAPEKTTRDAIVDAARDLVEVVGVDGVTMQAVAERVGVRAPSLYKRVRDRQELLALVVGASVGTLAEALGSTEAETDPGLRLIAQAEAVRRFAHERPVGFALIFGAHGAPRPDPAETAQSITPLLNAVAALTGPEHALDGARLLTAWISGFLNMELAGYLRMGGDIDAAWRWGLERMVAALRLGGEG